MRLDGDEDGALVQLLAASETAQQGKARAFFAAPGDDEALSRLLSETADETDPPEDDGVDIEID